MIQYPGKTVALGPDIPAEARDWRNDPKIYRWCRQHTLITRADQFQWESSLVGNQKIKMFSVIIPKTTFVSMDPVSPSPETRTTPEVPVGVCGLTSIDRVNQTAEFSLYIAPEYHRKGYGKDALYTLLRHGFDDMNLNRIWGETFDENPAISMFKSLGLRYEGTLRAAYYREGIWTDSHIFGILKADFVE